MKTYPKYKPTNIEWIGNIPEHWKASKIAVIGKFSKGKGITKEDIVDLGLPCIRNGEIYTTYTRKTYSIKSRISLELSKELVSVENGAVLFTGDGETVEDIGKCLVYVGDERLYVGGGINIFVPDKSKANSEFLSYILNSDFVVYQKAREGKGEIVVHIYAKQLREILISIPPLPEQQAIVAFLDQKTALIDELIAKKEKKIELLKEKRTALINHVVTKGLDPTVKYKDSGIDWIGEIPEHWEIVKLGHLTRIVRGASPRPAGDPIFFDGDYINWITVGSVTNSVGKYVVETESFLTEAGMLQSRVVEPETLIISNSGATLGVPKILKIKGCINDGSVAFSNLKPTIERDFLYFFLVSQTELLREQQSGYGQPNLNTDIIANIRLPIPLNNEQNQIIEYLDSNLELIDQNINLELQKIEKLKEYRQSLISNVVTGKICVFGDD